MNKVLLLRTEEGRNKLDFKGIIENEPLDLEIIYTILKDEYQVSIFDKQVEEISVKKYLEDNHFDILYIEGRCFQENYMKEYIKEFKKKSNGLVIVGGYHAQLNYHRFYMDEVDYILIGFNYYDLPSIIKGDISSIKNLVYKKNNEWIVNEKISIDINDLPLATRNYFYDHQDNYRYLDLKHSLWIRSALSCPYNCKFCIRRQLNNHKYSRRNINDLVDEIEINNNENVYIVDDDFLFDREYILSFINEIKRRNIKRNYICYGRSDFISQNEDIIKAFKEIGLYYVLVGLEDIDNHKLDKYNKLNNINNNEECIRICKEHNVKLMAMFILGLDYKKEDFINLYKYIKKKDLRHVAISIYTPELGNEDVEYITDNPNHFDYLHLVCKPDYLSIKQYYIYYYFLLIKLFLKGKKEGIYDFIDYGDYLKIFIKNLFKAEGI